MSNDSFQLDTERKLPALDYLNWMLKAAKNGKGIGAMLKEMTSLQFGKGKIQPEEYFLYQLYDDERYTPEAKRTFVGINGPTVPSPWAKVVNDKPTLTAMLRGLDFPIPETQAIVHPDRSFGGAFTLRTPDEIRKFLREDAEYPIFGKPFDSACSLGTANIKEFDYAADALILSDGRSVSLDDFIDQIKRFDSKYLFQSLMRTHESLIPIVGERVCTVRMYVISDDQGCELLRASWKIPGFANGADNFWRTGNILAGIEVETGKIGRTLRRTKDGTEPITEHPLTGHSFEDLVFPHWDEMREIVLKAAPNLPGCHFQGWDVALTDRGPILVELEGDGGDPIMEQLCFDTGLLQGRFLRFLDKSKEIAKQEKAESKAHKLAKLKRNMAVLSKNNPAPESSEPAEADAASSAETTTESPTATAASEKQPGPSGDKAQSTEQAAV